jgi:rhodanese-related sulfurtransferase
VKASVDGKVKNVTMIDIRAAKDFAIRRIPGTINIPWEKDESFDENKTISTVKKRWV